MDTIAGVDQAQHSRVPWSPCRMAPQLGTCLIMLWGGQVHRMAVQCHGIFVCPTRKPSVRPPSVSATCSESTPESCAGMYPLPMQVPSRARRRHCGVYSLRHAVCSKCEARGRFSRLHMPQWPSDEGTYCVGWSRAQGYMCLNIYGGCPHSSRHICRRVLCSLSGGVIYDGLVGQKRRGACH